MYGVGVYGLVGQSGGVGVKIRRMEAGEWLIWKDIRLQALLIHGSFSRLADPKPGE